MKIRTIIVLCIIAFCIIAMCATAGLFAIRCNPSTKQTTYQNMNYKGAGLTPASYIEKENTMNITNPQYSVNYIKEVNGELLYPKIIPINDWNMDLNSLKSVAHGLGSLYKKIVAITGFIRNDADDVIYPICPGMTELTTALPSVYIVSVTATTISLARLTGGVFDSTDFDATSYKRGDLVIWFRQ